MQSDNKLPILIAGAAIFGVIYWWISSNGIVTEYMRPEVEKLGAGNANVLASLGDVLAAGAGMAVMFFTRAVHYLAGLIGPLLGVQASVSRETSQSKKVPAQALIQTLLHAIETQDAMLCVSILHRMAGSQFLKPFFKGSAPPSEYEK